MTDNNIYPNENLGDENSDEHSNEEKTAITNKEIDYSSIYELPTLTTRYKSILIDAICITLLFIGIATIFEKIGNIPDSVRGVTFVVVILLYEPILVSLGCTIGQFLMGIRVRDFKNPETKLNPILILVRFGVKVLLGWISFLTTTFNKNRRAIHDYASGSIMVASKLEKR